MFANQGPSCQFENRIPPWICFQARLNSKRPLWGWKDPNPLRIAKLAAAPDEWGMYNSNTLRRTPKALSELGTRSAVESGIFAPRIGI